MLKGITIAITLVAFTFAAGGCLITKAHQNKEEGVKVSQATLDQIEPGETTEAWLIAALGKPSSNRKVDDHTSILRYDHRVTTEKGGTVLFLYAGGESIEKAESVLFEVTDGVVTRYWTED